MTRFISFVYCKEREARTDLPLAQPVLLLQVTLRSRVESRDRRLKIYGLPMGTHTHYFLFYAENLAMCSLVIVTTGCCCCWSLSDCSLPAPNETIYHSVCRCCGCFSSEIYGNRFCGCWSSLTDFLHDFFLWPTKKWAFSSFYHHLMVVVIEALFTYIKLLSKRQFHRDRHHCQLTTLKCCVDLRLINWPIFHAPYGVFTEWEALFFFLFSFLKWPHY